MSWRAGLSAHRLAFGLWMGLVAAGCSHGLISGQDVVPADQDLHFEPGHILLKAKAGVDVDRLDMLLAAHGADAWMDIGGQGFCRVQVEQGAELSTVNALRKNADVEFAELDMLMAPQGFTNDPRLPDQWHLPRIGATSAWTDSVGEGITIAILDAGVADHPDLVAALLPGYNSVDGSSNSSALNVHGTAAAGVAAAAGLLFGLAVLTRETVLYFLPLAALWLAWRRPGGGRRAAVLLGTALLVILPWTLRNWMVFRTLVPVSTAGALNLWQGNTHLTRQEVYEEYWAVRGRMQKYRYTREKAFIENTTTHSMVAASFA